MADTTNTASNGNATQEPATALPARLETGMIAPDFTLAAIVPDDWAGPHDATDAYRETTVTLSDLTAGGRRVILYCYPAAMTPGCTTEACDFRDSIARLGTLGYTVLGVSKDPLDKLRRFAERDHLTFPLLSDPDLAVHRSYGAYGEKKLYGKTHVGVLRSTFAIGADGRILLARYNVRAKGHVESLMKALAKLD
ncbi:peroxiredoxin [Bifidobacterium amazonense]|uniref:thioredoxin-dependent peroxiredoxin n=1 Tax=Bifidobacterium amazonense TaxID=2809027 RepID=A0ABS9VX82_9BIFI|nr:peroxiredoxin [Bifidobacterium amazonense]MCH9276673.1 peroxiredoxin [Bifidobacterium amazonense]